jgi:peroxiredoxin
LLSDADGRLAREYGVWDETWSLAKRVTFVIDRAGRVRYVEPGRLAIDTSRTLDAVQKLARAK